MDMEMLEKQLAQLPLFGYFFLDPKQLEFSDRVRRICEQECPMYNRTWACPPAVGAVEDCRKTCLSYEKCLVIVTAAEVADITDINEALATRPAHELVTNQVRQLLREQEADVYVLSTEACAQCERCAWVEGKPCRFPEKMHPCVESHGINLIPTLEANGIEFQYGANVVTWVSLLFY